MSMISNAQREALDKLARALPPGWYLAGGIAVAAHLQHRTSRDLDLFADMDPIALQPTLEQVPGLTIESRSPGTLYVRIDGIPASLIQYRYPVLEPPTPSPEIVVPVASLIDLGCMKLSAIASRGAARDFWDLHEIVGVMGGGLSALVAAFGRKYPVEDVGHVLRSLVYFGDADAAPLPPGLTQSRWQTIKTDFEVWVPQLIRP